MERDLDHLVGNKTDYTYWQNNEFVVAPKEVHGKYWLRPEEKLRDYQFQVDF